MIPAAVVSRYAGALADVATAGTSRVQPRQVLEELRTFETALALSKELQNALTSPAVPPGRKRAVVSRLAERMGLSRIVGNFLFVLIDHRRTAGLSQIIESFEVQLDQRLGFARADVTSARDLDARQQAALTEELSRLTGKRMRLKFSVDPGLIGGVVARIGSTIYDGSVRGQLSALARRLTAE
jgi:F-type H+-transporting ATPase subunit delta